MHRRLLRLIGTVSVGGGCYLLGSQYPIDRLLPEVNAATALVPQPLTSLPPLEPSAPGASLTPSRASQIMAHGYPGFDNLRTFEDFVLSYDRRTRIAHWVCEHLTPDRLIYDASVDRSKCQFRPDESMHPYFRAQNEDYKGSGYDRGHMAAAGNHRRSQNSVDQTFLLTNMSPQVGRGFNRDKWNELEKYVRGRAKKCKNLYVVTGPLFLPRKEADGHLYVKYKVIGKGHVAVPTHFFKVILIENPSGDFELESYLLPNEAIPETVALSSFHVPLEMIERSAGFLIFEKVPKKNLKAINGKKAGIW